METLSTPLEYRQKEESADTEIYREGEHVASIRVQNHPEDGSRFWLWDKAAQEYINWHSPATTLNQAKALAEYHLNKPVQP